MDDIESRGHVRSDGVIAGGGAGNLLFLFWKLQQMLVTGVLLLMVQKSGDHQLRLVVYPFIYRFYRVLAPSQVVVSLEFLNHQQYQVDMEELILMKFGF